MDIIDILIDLDASYSDAADTWFLRSKKSIGCLEISAEFGKELLELKQKYNLIKG